MRNRQRRARKRFPYGQLPSRHASLHHQTALAAGGFGRETTTEEVHDLIAHLLAARAPATGADELLGASPQAGEPHHARRISEAMTHRVAQAREELEFEGAATPGSDRREIGGDRRRFISRSDRADLQTKAVEDLFQS